MSDPAFIQTLQQEIHDLRAQAALLPPGTIRTRLVARATALETARKAHLLVGLPIQQSSQADTDRPGETPGRPAEPQRS